MAERSTWTLVDWSDRDSHPPRRIDTKAGPLEVRWDRLHGGRSEGVELLSIDTGAMEVHFLPTRGMGIWRINSDGLDIGWQSPTRGPVHPAWVPIFDPSGIGWLEGFDELLVRCGLQSNGAPQFAPNGQLQYPLHGRIANLPAEQVEVTVDHLTGDVTVEAIVHESRFLIYELRLKTTYKLRAGSRLLQIQDSVINASARPSSMQLLYHINLGSPILQGGSKLHMATDRVVPRNDYSAGAIEHWNLYAEPKPGFAEQVYFTRPIADSQGWAHALLEDAAGSHGVAVRSRVDTLPYFVIWKNTAAETDGYVTGLEPATGFPNARSFEEQHKRVVELSPGEKRVFDLELEIVTTPDRCQSLRESIHSIARAPRLETKPDSTWCSA